MKNLFILLVFFLFSSLIRAQESPVYIEGMVTNKITDTKMGGVTVELRKNGSVIETKSTSSNGRYKFSPVTPDSKYTVTFVYPDYITRFVDLDFSELPQEQRLPQGYELKVDMTMVERVPNINYSGVENKSTGGFVYKKSDSGMTWDMKSVEAYKKELDKILDKIIAEKDKAAENEIAFKKAIQDGDAAMKTSNYDVAVKKYEEAATLKPDDPSAKEKLADAQQKKKAAEDAKGLEKKYAEAIAAAEAAFKKADYTTAKDKYTEAKDLKPNEPLPPQKIAEINGLINKQIEADTKFNQFMADGNKAMETSAYDAAITAYTEALKIKPGDPGAKAELDKANAAKKAADVKNAEFDKLVKKGDTDAGIKKYDDAIISYESALVIKSDPAVQAKLDKVRADKEAAAKLEEEKLAEQKKNQKYQELITKADTEFKTKNWDGAIESYTAALEIKPAEKYPSDQIGLAKKNKDEEAKNAEAEQKYKDLLAEALTKMDNKEWDAAIQLYTEAQPLKPTDKFPAEQINIAKQKKQDELASQQKKAEYDTAIKKADDEFNAGNYQAAIPLYTAAQKVLPSEKYPSDQIILCNENIAKAKDEAAKKAELEKKFNELVTKADASVTAKKYDEGITLYQEALTLKDDAGVQEKLKKAQDLKAEAELKAQEAADKEARYKTFIDEGNEFFANRKWEDAIAAYEKAKELKPAEKLPPDQIIKAKAEWEKQKKEEEALETQAKLDKAYQAALDAGDVELSNGNFDAAIAKYTEAKTLKPKETVPPQKIAEANKQKADKAAEMASAAEKEAKYAEAMKKAQADFNSGNFDGAIEKGNEALSFKPGDKPATDLVSTAEQKKAEKLKDIQKMYNDLITQADKDLNAGDLESAKKYYSRASNILKDEQYPKDKLNEITQLEEKKKKEEAEYAEKKKQFDALVVKADAEFNASKWNEAINTYESARAILPDEPRPPAQIKIAKDKLEELANQQRSKAELEAKYKELVEQGNDAFTAKSYDDAITAYSEALKIKPGEKYPDDQIKKIMALKEAEAKNLADQQKRQQYEEYIAAADEAFDNEKWSIAVDNYTKAKDLFPTEKYPPAQIALANQKLNAQADYIAKKKQYEDLIQKADKSFSSADYNSAIKSYQDALAVFKDEKYPAEQIIEAQNKLKELDALKGAKKLYDEAMKRGMDAFNAGSFPDAISHFTTALNHIPNDPDATRMLNEAKKKKEEKDAFIRQQYDLIIQKADEYFNNSSWNDAKGLYERALKIFPDEPYPSGQLAKIAEELKKLEGAQSEAQRYNSLINEANGKFDAGNYQGARDLYVQASSIKPDLDYPKKRIKEIDDLLRPKNNNNNQNSFVTQTNTQNNAQQIVPAERNYGEPVNISIEEAQKMMQQMRIASEQKNTDRSDQEKATKENNELAYSLKHDKRRLEKDKDFTETEIERSELGIEADKPRQESVTEYRNYIQKREETNEELAKRANTVANTRTQEYEQLKIEMIYESVGTDEVRLQNISELSDLKARRDEAESDLSSGKTDANFEKSENLREQNFQLQDQLGGQDVIRQEKEKNLADFKEQRYESESDLSGNTTEKNFEKSQDIRQQNYQLQDQLGGQDVIRQEKEKNLADFKEQRYESESDLSGNTTERNFEKSQDIRQQNYQLQDQLGGKDEYRKEKVEEYKEIQNQKDNLQSEKSKFQENRTQSINDSINKAKILQEEKNSELAKRTNENIEKLKNEEEVRNQKQKEISDNGDQARKNNNAELEYRKNSQNTDPRSEEKGVLVSEKSFQRTDNEGKPTEITFQRMVKKGNVTYEYLMITNKQGVNFYKNGKPISETQWSVETSVPKG